MWTLEAILGELAPVLQELILGDDCTSIKIKATILGEDLGDAFLESMRNEGTRGLVP